MREAAPRAESLLERAKRLIEGYEALLASPAFEHKVDLAVLAKLATSEAVPPRERLRAAEVLATTRARLMETLAGLLCVRDQSLDALGLTPKALPHSLTQVNQRIEIVRAADWRNAPALGEGDPLRALPEPPANGAEVDDGPDPPA